MLRKSILVFIAILLIIFTFFISKNFLNPKSKVTKKDFQETIKYVKIIKAKYENYPSIVKISGRVNSYNQININSEVSGKVVFLNKDFKIGQKYKKGDLLVSIDKREITLQLKSLKSKFYNSLTSIISDIKLDYPGSYNEFKTYIDNFNLDVEIFDLPKVTDNRLKYFLSNNNIFVSFYDIKSLELKYEKHDIKAPFDCEIISSSINLGSNISIGQAIGILNQLNSKEFEFGISYKLKNLISLGSKIKFNINNEDLYGEIIRISDQIETSTQNIKCFARLNSNNFYIGEYLDAEIVGKELKNVVKINRNAIYNNEFILIAENDRLIKKEVNLIHTDENFAFISNVKEGDKIINQTISNYELGSKVKNIESAK